MPRLPSIPGRELVRFIGSLGFRVVRTRGSHVRMAAPDGRVTTVPVHAGREVPRGLLRKIVRDDLEMTLEEFGSAWTQRR